MSQHTLQLVLATRNMKKQAELQQLLAGLPCEVLTLAAFSDCPEVAETGTTFAENAALKACAVAAHTGRLTLADDSGLAVDALDGAPGVHSARYAADGPANATDQANIDRLLQELQEVPDGERTGRFVCAIAVARGGEVVFTTQGTVEGELTRAPRGTQGFGYDPVFYYPSYGRTLAEVSAAEKAAVSHRGQALAAFRDWLQAYLRGATC